MTSCYFAYGSNMNSARMRARGLNFVKAEAAILPRFRLVFNKQSHCKPSIAYANVQHASDHHVEGVLYTLAKAEDLDLMDHFEGTPVRYSRECVHVNTSSGPRSTWIYMANPAYINNNLLPESSYLAHLLAGRDFLSGEYIDMLTRHESVYSEPIVGEQGLLRNA
jgi:gamma-glutamylcyclotransferase (GGCT)/AIG2-like uncharacterized protein YtfP